MRKMIRDRKATQAEYQRGYRAQQAALRKPSRDDVARAALHWIITEALERNKEGELAKWSSIIVSRLVEQGFDRDAASSRINQLTEMYEDGWTFQRKPHLLKSDRVSE